jgi:GNAT superfamily N-acetyltransferase
MLCVVVTTRKGGRMELATREVLDGPGRELGWQLYRSAFDELRIRAVQRHVMTRPEFDAVMDDRRITKYEVLDPDRDGRMCGLATMTNHLEAMPLISPDYFEHRWPSLFRQRHIWYVGFVGVDPDYQGTGVFADIVGSMCRLVAGAGGVAVLDVCRRADQVYGLPAAIARLNDTFSDGGSHERIDEQSYWAYEFPASK